MLNYRMDILILGDTYASTLSFSLLEKYKTTKQAHDKINNENHGMDLYQFTTATLSKHPRTKWFKGHLGGSIG